MRKGKVFSVAVTLMAVAGLAGCASEPSEADIKAALLYQLGEQSSAVKNMGKDLGVGDLGGELAKGFIPELVSVKKLGCAKAGEKGGYNCDIEMVTKMKMVGEQKSTGSMRFVKTDGGWRVVN